MDQKRSPSRPKRQSKSPDESYWDCSVCTYKNSAEAFKCEICDVRKGTSTRKPRLNSQIVSQQVAVIPPPPPKQIRNHSTKKSPLLASSSTSKRIRPRLKNIDRNSGTPMAVTVNDVTVIITDYKPSHRSSISSSMVASPSSSSSQESNHGDNNNSSHNKFSFADQTNENINGF
ncbi:YY1-associated factor 2-like [Saccoglossus kowalevskii]|uniref:YY1-associated factor 2-like n=1 Tax=Saccoglossus kowalevskii TaxID=10224 RepID=A0ABM0MFV3_SACKO|nr:PREDICTED: YY1-associated factor 2-like [Saccoglossus kowalevskii]